MHLENVNELQRQPGLLRISDYRVISVMVFQL